MRAHDPMTIWFEALAALGEDIDIRLVRVTEAGGEPQWFTVPHTEMDGVGAIGAKLHATGDRTSEPLLLPVQKNTRKPGFWARLWGVFRALRTKPVDTRRVRGIRGADPGPPLALAWRILSAEDTARVAARAEAAGVSRNSYMLACWNASIESEFEDGDGRLAVYLVPVNLRTEPDAGPGNHAANLVIPLGAWAAPTEVHAKIRAELAANHHWSAWDLTALVGRAGRAKIEEGMRKAFAQIPVGGVSVFSNFGEWAPERRDAWAVFAPIAHTIPTTVALCKVGGRLGIGVILNRCLSTDPADAERWVERYVGVLLGDTAGSVDA